MDLLQFVRGCTFDDFLLMPQLGTLPSRDPAVIVQEGSGKQPMMRSGPAIPSAASAFADVYPCTQEQLAISSVTLH